LIESAKRPQFQLQLETGRTQDRIDENNLVNDIHRRVALWRTGGYQGVTPTTARLIAYWTDPNRELFPKVLRSTARDLEPRNLFSFQLPA
jgi:type III restriction enzyme